MNDEYDSINETKKSDDMSYDYSLMWLQLGNFI